MIDTNPYIIYDVITKTEIVFNKGEQIKKCSELKISYTSISKLFKNEQKFIKHRYILPENKHLIFTLVNYETGKEYDCVSNSTIFIHLNSIYDEKISKFIFELKRNRQSVCTINGKLFYLKSNGKPIIRGHTNCEDLESIKKIRNNNKIKNKLVRILRKRLIYFIYSTVNSNTENAKQLLGCTIEEFKNYLENQFIKGMTWENYGKIWHIDHIRPCASFNLFDLEEIKKCFYFKNLRPLWATTEIARKFGDMESIGNCNKGSKLVL